MSLAVASRTHAPRRDAWPVRQSLTPTRRAAYALAVTRVSKVEHALKQLLHELQPAASDHLSRATLADEVARVAERLSRSEVMAARELDDATWQNVADAFGISRQGAHERFRTGPDGLHSRLYKRHEARGQSGSAATGDRSAPTTSRASRKRAADRS